METDEVLLARVREHRDADAFGTLYERHAPAARRFARSLCAKDADADDLTAEVFAGLLASLHRGTGPTQLVLPYVFASIKHRHWRTAGRRARESAVAVSTGPSAPREADDIVEADVLRMALSTLSPDMQALLWRTEVDDECVDDHAERDAKAAHSLAVHRHRARRALGTAYLAQHAQPDGGLTGLDPECQASLPDLASLVRNKLGVRRRRRLERHLALCPRCTQVRTRLERINTHLRAHLMLPWNMWSIGLTPIKAQVWNWVGMSAATLAGPSVLAAAILVPAPAMVEHADGPEATSPTAAVIQRARARGLGVDTGTANPADRSGSPVLEPDDVGGGSWFHMPAAAVSPSPHGQPTGDEPAATEATPRVVTTSEPAPAAELTLSVGRRDDVDQDVAAPTGTPAAVQTPVAPGVTRSVAPGGIGSDRAHRGEGQGDDDDQGEAAHTGSPKGAVTGQDNSQGPGNGNANGSGNGLRNANGQGNGNGNGNGNGLGNANGLANGSGQGSGNGNGGADGQGAKSTQGSSHAAQPVPSAGGAPNGQAKGQRGSDEQIDESQVVANGKTKQVGPHDEQAGQGDAGDAAVADVEVTTP